MITKPYLCAVVELRRLLDKYSNERRIQLAESLGMNLLQHDVRRLSLPVNSAKSHGMENIRDPHDFCVDMDFAALKP